LNGPIYTLDRTDLKILDILQTDGRISNSKLAELVNLSPTAVMARVKLDEG
jgi:Lrp/AsnC family leucine-responsive transcriptional regulator